jgi:hypothetical protein
VHPVFEFRRDDLVLTEVGGVPDRLLGFGYLYEARLSFTRTSSTGIRVE